MSSTPYRRLNPQDATSWLAAHPHGLVLDARQAPHHAQERLEGSLRLDGRNHESLLLSQAKSRPVFIYCYRGNASQTYAQMFADFGFDNVVDLIGGWEAWQRWQAQQGSPAPGSAPDKHAAPAAGVRDVQVPAAAAAPDHRSPVPRPH